MDYYSYVYRVMRKTPNNMMMKVQILKNDVVIKTLPTSQSKLQATTDIAYDTAGGMWNGTDVFKIVIKSV